MTSATPLDRLSCALDEARDAGRLALVPFVTAGFPDGEGCLALLDTVARAGADALELGVPFSDPLADGPTIQRTSQIAIEGGATLAAVLDLVRAFRRRHETPIVLMTYANPVLCHGIEAFAHDAAAAGAEAVLVTDVPHDEMRELWEALEAVSLGVVRLVAPTTPPARVAEIAASASASAFVYCISRMDVTGKGHEFAQNLAAQVACTRRATDRPVLVGFGMRDPSDIAAVKEFADGVVVGAALLERVLEADDRESGVRSARAFIEALAGTLGR